MQYKVLASAKDSKRQLFEYNHNSFYGENVKPTDGEKYESLYLYNDAHKKKLDETGKLSGVKDVVTNKVVFDFDSKDSPQEALNDSRVLVDMLRKNIPNQAIRCYFSGNKGYHVEIHFNDGEYINREQFESIIYSFGSNLSTFDPKVKDEQRIFRMPFSKHTESGLYKVPIAIDDFVNPEVTHQKIMTSATKENLDNLKPVFDAYITTAIPQIFKGVVNVAAKQKATKANPTDRPNMVNRPAHISPAKYALMQGYFDEGDRHEACMALCATFRGFGYPREVAYNMLKSVVRLRNERLGLGEYDKKELYSKVVDSIYSPTWEGGVYSEKSGVLLKTIETYNLQKTNSGDVGLLKIDDLSDSFADFAKNIEKNTIKLGIDEIDAKLRITTSMFVCLLAPPSAGKTSVALGILNTLSKAKEKAIFFSMDMAIPQVYQRLIQRHTGENQIAITDNYKNENSEKTEGYKSTLAEHYENIRMCFKTGLNAETIRETIINEADVSGKMPRLVIVDYLECIAGPFTDSTANKALIATQLKDIANELGICLLLIVQPAKVSGDPSQELNSYTQIKGSSVLGEAATIVIAMSRPGFSPKNPEMDKFLTINVVKNRMGELSSTTLNWNGITGHVRTMTEDEKFEYNNFMAAKELAGDDAEVELGSRRMFNPAAAARKKEMF